MNLSDPLHAGALLVGIAAAFWALSTFAGLLFPLGALLFMIGAIVLLFARRIEATARRFLRTGAIASLGAHLLLIILFVVSQPFGFGRENPVRIEPPTWGAEVLTLYAPLYMILVAAFVVFMFFHTWRVFERGVGFVAIAALIAGLGLGYLTPATAPAAMSLLISLLVAAGFAALAVAALIPPLKAEHAPWRAEPAGANPRGPAPTGNP